MICDDCDEDPDTCGRDYRECTEDAELCDAEWRFEAERDSRD